VNSNQLGWVAFGLLAVFILFTWMFPDTGKGGPQDPQQESVGSVPVPAPASPTPGAAPTISGSGSTFSGKDAAGNTTWKLRAESIKYEGDRVEGSTVHCTFYGKDNKAMATLVAAAATLNTKTEDMDFQGEVVATNPLGDRMTVRKLQYSGARKKFFGTKGIKVTRATSVLTGDTMVADPTMKTVEIRGNVRAVVHSLAVNQPPGFGPAADQPQPGPTGATATP